MRTVAGLSKSGSLATRQIRLVAVSVAKFYIEKQRREKDHCRSVVVNQSLKLIYGPHSLTCCVPNAHKKLDACLHCKEIL